MTSLSEPSPVANGQGELQTRIDAAMRRVASLSPVERAIHDLEQRRSLARGSQRLDANLGEVDKRLASWPEFVLLQAYRELKHREQELLEANNRYLQRARDAEAALAESIRLDGELAQRIAAGSQK